MRLFRHSKSSAKWGIPTTRSLFGSYHESLDSLRFGQGKVTFFLGPLPFGVLSSSLSLLYSMFVIVWKCYVWVDSLFLQCTVCDVCWVVMLDVVMLTPCSEINTLGAFKLINILMPLSDRLRLGKVSFRTLFHPHDSSSWLYFRYLWFKFRFILFLGGIGMVFQVSFIFL